MKHIKKFKLFENKIHPSDYLKDDFSYVKINSADYDYILDNIDAKYFDEKHKSPPSESKRIQKAMQNLYDRFDDQILKSSFSNGRNGDNLVFIYSLDIFNKESKILNNIIIYRIHDEDYYIIESDLFKDYFVDDHTETWKDKNSWDDDLEYFLCDGINGIKQWSKNYELT
jgi:hypothetical protein